MHRMHKRISNIIGLGNLPRAVVKVRVPRRPGAVEGERQLLVVLVLLTPHPEGGEHLSAQQTVQVSNSKRCALTALAASPRERIAGSDYRVHASTAGSSRLQTCPASGDAPRRRPRHRAASCTSSGSGPKRPRPRIARWPAKCEAVQTCTTPAVSGPRRHDSNGRRAACTPCHGPRIPETQSDSGFCPALSP